MMMGEWFDLTGDARLGACATEGCGGQPTKRLEAGGVGSNYCSGCAAKITALSSTPAPDGMEDRFPHSGMTTAEAVALIDRNTIDGLRIRLEAAEAQVKRLTEDNEALRADKARLDYLDSLNAALNARYGTKYGWELIVNHNVTRAMFNFPRGADLNDAAAHGFKSCRDAIDRRMAEGTAYRRAEADRATLNSREKAE